MNMNTITNQGPVINVVLTCMITTTFTITAIITIDMIIMINMIINITIATVIAIMTSSCIAIENSLHNCNSNSHDKCKDCQSNEKYKNDNNTMHNDAHSKSLFRSVSTIALSLAILLLPPNPHIPLGRRI